MTSTQTQKNERISNLTNEVHDIHPILRNLFPTLPFVKAVEYTHGPNEFGADFVLAKEDSTLETITYIGVIVKRGDITLSNYHDTSRQINELKLERTFDGGKTKINITEVWVVSNCKITDPAKKIINSEHSASKVQFISGEKIVQLIDKHIPNFWNQSSAALAGYLKLQKSKLEETDLKLSLLGDNSTNVFFEPEIRECEKDEYKQNTRKKVKNKIINIYEALLSNKIIFIEGEPGIGKSKLLRHIAAKLIDNCNPNNLTIPVFFTFKEFVDTHNKNLSSLLKEKLGESYEELNKTKNVRFTFIADSLDECRRESNHAEVLQSCFSEILKNENYSCIASSRHIDRHLLENDSLQEALCTEIMPMSPKVIVDFLKQITKDISIPSRILEDIKRSKLFRDLPKSPIAAILLAKILKDELRDLPSTLPELYSQFVEICVGRWEIQISLKNQKEYKALNSILQNISIYLMENGINHLNIDEAKRFYREFLENRGFGIDIDDFFERTTARCPIICILQSNSTFAFKHKSFVEFYYAKSMINRQTDHKINERALNEYWSHSFYFYIGLLEEPDLALSEYIDVEPKSDIGRYHKFTNLSDVLLAGYAARTEILTKGIARAAVTAAQFYCNAIRNPKESSLRNFSQIHLLWLTQFSFKSAFCYDFFKAQFDEAAFQILETTSDEQEQSVALFLLDVTLLVGSKEAEFKLLCSSFKSIPLSLKLGIEHESEGMRKGKFVKKLDKNMRERFRSDPKFKSEVHKLYEERIEKFSIL